MTGAVFTFAFLAALLIGLIAGFLIARYTRLGGGGSRSRKQDRDDLAEHIRLLNDRLNHRNNDSDYCLGRPQQFRHDRTYLNDEKLAHAAANQAELMPLYMDTRRSVGSAVTAAAFASGGSDAGLERLHPHSVPDQSLYQDWDLTGSTPVMTSMSPFIVNHPSATAAEYAPRDSNPALFRTSATRDEMADYRGVRVVNLPPSQLPPDVEIYSPKGEWSSGSGAGGGVGGGGANASRTSVANLNEFERRRPQIQEDGLGEDSLFDIGHQSHNPHVTAIME
ncbi:hypothetical protein BGX23_003909 [Mortierella sp. AD031]|nr:hypothetical protein BGX23_003909 [Mortierella sp. AD031]